MHSSRVPSERTRAYGKIATTENSLGTRTNHQIARGNNVRRNAWMAGAVLVLTSAVIALVTQTQVQAQINTPKPIVAIDDTGAVSGPTVQGALSTEETINQAILTGDANALAALLADDWVVVSGFGDIASKAGFVEFIRQSGPRRTMSLSEPRVRLYGDTALVTTRLDAVGPFFAKENGKVVRKCFAAQERQTDILVWNNGSWKSVLLHETLIPPEPKVTAESSACT